MPHRRGGLSLAVHILFFASGAAGLVYQVIWLRQLTLIFGATVYASSAVLSTFMGGLALGSFWAGRRADRWVEPPLRTYGKLEIGITLYAATIPWLLTQATPLLEIAWKLGADRHFAVLGVIKFIAIGILILPATTLMGATLPVLSRVASETAGSVGAGVGRLYAINTFGAVVGTLAAAFVALPALGMKRTLLANVALNGVVGLVAWTLGGRARPHAPPAEEEASPQATPVPGLLLVVFAASGFAAMVLEVAWTRSLSLVLGSSVYAYSSMLTAFLLGLASGAASAAAFLKRRRSADPRIALSMALAAAGLLSFVAAYVIQSLPRLFAEIYFRIEPSPEGWWLAQLAIALVIMFPATYALGWMFPLGLEAVGAGRAGVASSVGRVYAANTIGTILGAACGGFLFVPLVGVGTTLVGVAAGQIALAVLPLVGDVQAPATKRIVFASVLTVLAVGCIVFRPAWDVLMMNSGVYINVQNSDPDKGWEDFRRRIRGNNELVYARDGLTASVLVAWQPLSDNMYLAVNGKTDASSREDLETQIKIGHLPLLFHPAPRDVAIIGLASGITVGATATHPVENIRVIEVESAMVEAARRFAEFNHAVLDDPRVSVSINDARNELQFNAATYDVIISEPSNPWLTVAANLFTQDFFQVGKSRLREGGVFGQWLQTYSLTPECLASILASFHRTFPHVLIFGMTSGVDLLVVGSGEPLQVDVDEIERRISPLWIRADLARVGVRNAFDLVAMLQTGGTAIRDVVGRATPNSDDNGLVEFAAPKALYLDTQDANTVLLQGNSGDPLLTLANLVTTSESADRFRLELIERWVRWDEKPRAARAAEVLVNPELRSHANALLTATQ